MPAPSAGMDRRSARPQHCRRDRRDLRRSRGGRMVTTVTDGWLGWHFTDRTERLRFGDGRKVIVGKKLTIDGEPMLCRHGLHATPTVLDALRDAPGPILHRVKLSGNIVYSPELAKACATERTSLAKINA